jgi:8-oxo-dGTP pyrophosphatase MutT (NUDIX family)
MTAPEPTIYEQSGVIPYRRAISGWQFLLITSRNARRWLIPKGLIEPDLSAADSALKEAFEEAGIRGRIVGQPIGSYCYEKWGGICQVQVFLCEVTAELSKWPEQTVRQRAWYDVEDAVAIIEDPALRALLQQAADQLDG